ncbi:hypothetical protein K431DRAFT_308066 [Polychaeton citri CBS 116435]|uniref:Uncharacterized protein n=1 Tax=Polychaeton citri CBS 116435 TaxID=1314669 RepID=A0A9P4Q0F8_9PEZI|nr:hypothetical protein K431DRAFT_308066 [Polychaeton citri CBS 116435]
MVKSFIVPAAFFEAHAAAQSTLTTITSPIITGFTSVAFTSINLALTTASGSSGIVSPQYALAGYDGCSSFQITQITQIKNGFSNMVHMLMGDQIFRTYPSFDQNNSLNRAAAVTYQWYYNSFASRLHVRCDDPLKKCDCPGPNKGIVTAYNIGVKKETNFCAGYFGLPDLARVLVYQPEGLWEFVDKFYNKGTWVHKLMHMSAVGHPVNPLDPHIIDQLVKQWKGILYDPMNLDGNKDSYSSSFAKWAAQSDAVIITDAIDNAENYALFATAYYVQKNLDYYPHINQPAISPTSPSDFMAYDVDGPSQANLSAAGFARNSLFNYKIFCYSQSG